MIFSLFRKKSVTLTEEEVIEEHMEIEEEEVEVEFYGVHSFTSCFS